MPASTSDLPTPSPAGAPRPGRRPGVRHRLRALRARRGERIELRGRPLLGPGVQFEVAPGARLIIGDRASLGERCRICVHAGTVVIEEGAALGEQCVIAARTGVLIGARCWLGDGVTIIDFDHRFDDVETPVRLQELASSPVQIEAGAVLGPGAAVLRGVRVGTGARVGAHAVVTHDVAAGAAVEGVPVRPTKRARELPGPPCGIRRGGRGPSR